MCCMLPFRDKVQIGKYTDSESRGCQERRGAGIRVTAKGDQTPFLRL